MIDLLHGSVAGQMAMRLGSVRGHPMLCEDTEHSQGALARHQKYQAAEDHSPETTLRRAGFTLLVPGKGV